MVKIKKSIGLDKKSCNIIKKKQQQIRRLRKNNSERLISEIFENAIVLFYNKINEKLDPFNKEIIKRQTVYITEESNAKYNELAFKYKYNLQQLANLIIRTAYK